MRIDAASHQLPFPSRSRSAAPLRPETGDQASTDRGNVVSVDWSQRAQQAEGRAYYNADRDLPFTSRTAVETYQLTSTLNLQPGEAELLGIDLYA